MRRNTEQENFSLGGMLDYTSTNQIKNVKTSDPTDWILDPSVREIKFTQARNEFEKQERDNCNEISLTGMEEGSKSNEELIDENNKQNTDIFSHNANINNNDGDKYNNQEAINEKPPSTIPVSLQDRAKLTLLSRLKSSQPDIVNK